MPSVQYTALRSLSGVIVGTLVNYNIPTRYAGMLHTKQSVGSTRVSLSGQRERWQVRVEHSYAITTPPLDAAKQVLMRMFLDSVEQGESFLFSPTGGAFATAYLDSLDYDEPRHPSIDTLVTYNLSIVTIP